MDTSVTLLLCVVCIAGHSYVKGGRPAIVLCKTKGNRTRSGEMDRTTRMK